MKHLPEKTTLAIFRDCLRAAPLMNSNPVTIGIVRASIKEQFRRNMHESNPEKIDELRWVYTFCSDTVRSKR